MEIRKEDLVKFKIVNTTFYAFPTSIMDKEEIPPLREATEEETKKAIEEAKADLELQKEKDAKLMEEMKLEKEKADKKAKLIAELAALED